MALKKMSIKTPRVQSSKRRENHFYAPYTPSKRRTASDPNKTSSLSLAEVMPIKRSISGEIGKEAETDQKPWGHLISKSLNLGNILLSYSSTGIGELLDVVDIDTGDRMRKFSKSLS